MILKILELFLRKCSSSITTELLYLPIILYLLYYLLLIQHPNSRCQFHQNGLQIKQF